MTVEERLREWIERPRAPQRSGSFMQLMLARELLAELSKLRAVAEAAKEYMASRQSSNEAAYYDSIEGIEIALSALEKNDD